MVPFFEWRQETSLPVCHNLVKRSPPRSYNSFWTDFSPVSWRGRMPVCLLLAPEEEPHLENSLQMFDWLVHVWTILWGIFLINDWRRRAQHTAGSTIPRQLVLDSIRKQSWASYGAQFSKQQHCILVSASDSCSDFSWWWTVAWKCLHESVSQMNPFLP